jgi:hypothetical protein
MVNDPVDSIADTKLFASFNNNKTRQLMIYSNKIDNKLLVNAMVLPVPNSKSIIFHSMKEIPEFFNNLDTKFTKKVLTRSFTNLSRSFSYDEADNDTLEVLDIGSYLISKVDSINDFKKLDKTYFELSTNIQNIVELNYDGQFGYLVCKLKQGNLNYEPLAYSHDVYIKNNKPYLFLPSYHYHPDPHFNTNIKSEIYADDWSHDVYIVNFNPKAYFNNYLTKLCNFYEWTYNNNKKNVGYDKFNFDFPHDLKNYQKFHIEGKKLNTDIIVEAF